MESAPCDWKPDIEQFRAVLRLLVRLDVDPRLLGKLDLSGVVQQTLLEAHQGLVEFRGDGDDALLAWLRQILTRNLLDEIRKLRRARFDVTREESLEEISSAAENRLVAWQSSPGTRAACNEDLLRLASALDQLPEDQRTAVVRRHLQGVSLAEICVEMSRSKPAVASLLHRGITKLRDLLAESTRP